MRNRGHLDPKIVLFDRAQVTEHLAERTFVFQRCIQWHIALDDHLGMCGHLNVAGFTLDDVDGLAAHTTGDGQFIDLALDDSPVHNRRTADCPGHRILTNYDRHWHTCLAALPRRDDHLVTHVIGFGIQTELARPFDLAPVGTEVWPHLRVMHEH